ncbi:MAG: hypothetical protein QOI42_1238 [Frankiaceae bacterium]|jgi:hypothetical protein|nr:hypothetical protein [Frankiaceae bacterium]
MTRKFASLAAAALSLVALTSTNAVAAPSSGGTGVGAPRQLQVYGAWLCSNDACGWSAVRDMTDFDHANHWLVDRGDGRPSVNVVVLSFVNPLALLNGTNGNGLPVGMNQAVVNYFTSRGVRVQLSIGGITYTSDWDTALSTNATQLGLNAAAVARQLGVGFEIDYEQNTSPNLAGMQAFITAYRSQLPYDASGATAAARLTIDVAAGDRWLIDVDRKATTDWLRTDTPVLDYANAMVPSRQPSSSAATSNWQEHVDGKPSYSPVIPPLAPAKFTGSLYITDSSQVIPECNNFANSLQKATGAFVQGVNPNGAGTTNGMLGYMFWAAEKPSTRNIATTPPNSCELGVGTGATTYSIPVPMPALRQS